MAETTAETVAPGTRKSAKDKILSRIGDLRKTDPKLYEAMRLIAEDLDKVTLQLNPVAEIAAAFTASVALPPPVIAGTYSLTSTAVILSWTAPAPIGSTMFYEIRKGATWGTADFVLRTPSLSAALNPLTVGEHEYLVKTLNTRGDESVDEYSIPVTIPALGSVSPSALVIDNNVLLSWNEPTSTFTVDYYKITKDASPVGEISGTWFNLFESSAGTFLYGITAVDIAGNESAEGTVNVSVDEPPDFELHSTFNLDVTSGSHSSTYYESYDGYIYGPADLTEQFGDHFTSEGWAHPQAQVDDGHSLYIQDNPLTGIWTSDEEDLTTELNNVIVNFQMVNETVDTTDAPTWTVEMMLSSQAQGPLGGAWIAGFSQFSEAVRYIAVRITITAAGAAPRDSMGRFKTATVNISVKNVIDGTDISCLATDTEGDAGEEGTIVKFPNHGTWSAGGGNGTKTFTDINSITLTAYDDGDSGAGQAVTAIYDFVDVPNPDYFTILCFDSAGRRVDATVAWKVRGIKAGA